MEQSSDHPYISIHSLGFQVSSKQTSAVQNVLSGSHCPEPPEEGKSKPMPHQRKKPNDQALSQRANPYQCSLLG